MRRLSVVPRRSTMAGVVLAATLAMGVSAPAGASGGTVDCGTVTGSQVSTVSVYNCSSVPQTGGSGSITSPIPFFSGVSTGTIYWAVESGGTAKTVIRVRTRVVTAKRTPCPSGTTELKVSGRVRADTSGAVKVGGTVSATLCQTSNGAYSLRANSDLVIGG